MIGGPGWLDYRTPLDTPFNRKIHKEYASAMAKQRPDDTIVLGRKPYPVAYTSNQGGNWLTPCAVKFSDGSIYDNVIHKWRKESVDPIAQWERNKAADPLASSGMIQAGEHLVREVKQLRQRILDLEMEVRSGIKDHGRILAEALDDERDF